MLARRSLAVALVLLVSETASGQVKPKPRDLSQPQPITSFRPTQMGVGRDLVQTLERKWERKANRDGESLADFLKAKATRTEVPVVVSPSGDLLAVDRHHHITALRELGDREGLRLKLPVHVVKSYKGWSQSAFADDFVAHEGHFPLAANGLSPRQKLRLLPPSFDELADDPVRSAVGFAFRDLRLRRIPMKDYAELSVGDVARERGLVERARAFPKNSEPAQRPLVRAARELMLHDPEVREAVVRQGLAKEDREKIDKRLRKAD
jgi:hypothetical protein